MDERERLRWTRVGLLAALALALSFAETFVPIPLPGVKLGLANIPVLAALARKDARSAASVAAIKVAASGLLFGSPVTLAYALVGTALSLAAMIPLSRLRTMRLWMCSVVGALLHETGQLAVASLVLGTPVVWCLTPYLLLAGTATGALAGVVAQRLERALPPDEALARAAAEVPDVTPRRPTPRTLAMAALALVAVVCALWLDDSLVLGALASTGLACCLLRHVAARTLARSLRLIAYMAALTCVLTLMLTPGRAIAETGRAAARLACLTWMGLAVIGRHDIRDLCPTVAWLVSPLGRIGVDTHGFVLATDVALRTAPALVEACREELSAIGRRPRLRELPHMLEHVAERLAERL